MVDLKITGRSSAGKIKTSRDQNYARKISLWVVGWSLDEKKSNMNISMFIV